jgi:hypothetical protein
MPRCEVLNNKALRTSPMYALVQADSVPAKSTMPPRRGPAVDCRLEKGEGD